MRVHFLLPGSNSMHLLCARTVANTLTLVFLLSLIATVARADDVVPNDPPLQWWRGNLHTHSLWSDGDDFPEMIAEWYRTNGYNFLALSDHNVLSRGRRYMKLSQIEGRGGEDVLKKYLARFGKHWVETQGEGEEYAIRLKPLNEFRSLVEERGKFVMFEGEEISDRAQGGPIHMNATNLQELIEPSGGATVVETISNNLRAAEEQAKRLGREIMVHLNHPNFGYAVTAEDLAAVVQERFVEVYNGHPAVGHRGDKDHPSVERIWDIANTIRIGKLNAEPLWGIATDDSHNYHGAPNGSITGRGWVMVRARFLTPEHIIRALKAGDFYASSGVTLADIQYDSEKQEMRVSVDPKKDESYTIQFIGTREGYDESSEPRADSVKRTSNKYSLDIGKTLAIVTNHEATYRMQGDELYVRAVVTSSVAPDSPSFEGQKKQAWTQPFVPVK